MVSSYIRKEGILLANIGAVDSAPARTVPLPNECFLGRIFSFRIGSYSPEVVAIRNRGYSNENATHNIKAGNDTPLLTIPVLAERLTAATSYRPNISLRDGSYAVKNIVCARIMAGNNSPGSAIPMLDQRVEEFSVYGISYRPHIILRDGSYTIKSIIHARIRAGDDSPARTIPMFGQCLIDSIATLGATYCPDIA